MTWALVMDAKQQVESLTNDLLEFAKKMLAEHGEFHPFGGYLKSSAQMVNVGVKPSSSNESAQNKVGVLIGEFKRLTNEAIAFGIVTDVKLPRDDGSKGDAVQIFLEHKSGYCADVFFRYELTANRHVEITDTIAQRGDPLFFAAMH
ncbi:MAG TPA: hypothetical protein VJ806_16555 [Luteimonas sp.]|nr:hypothetical protein [Luteimonas sp.]